MARPSLTRAHRALLGVVAVGACLISGIGFAGSYSAVRELALRKGFGEFSYAFPVGVDAGIVVLLALDLVLTWLRIPFPLLRQAAWLLTVATIAFNAAASWGDPLGMGMHAVIPVLFVVVVEASRHAVGRIAAISADRHMESVRMMRWLLSPVPTFRMWRRMKLWELRSYDEVVRLEQNRLVYRAQLRFRYGRGWRRAAPIQALLPLKLAKFGVPLDVSLLDRIDPAPAPMVAPVVEQAPVETAVKPAAVGPMLAKLAASRWRDGQTGAEGATEAQAPEMTQPQRPEPPSRPGRQVTALRDIRAAMPEGAAGAQRQPELADQGAAARASGQRSPWFATAVRGGAEQAAPVQQQAPAPVQQPQPQPHQQQPVPAPAVEGVQRPPLTGAQLIALAEGRPMAPAPAPEPTPVAAPAPAPAPVPAPVPVAEQPELELEPQAPAPAPVQQARPQAAPVEQTPPIERQVENVFAPRVPVAPQEESSEVGRELTVEIAVEALIAYQEAFSHDPDEERLARYLYHDFGVTGRRPGMPPSRNEMARIWPYLLEHYATLGRE
ncbi:DUF2637 domain-containing protein [Kitasatospora sp. NPDC006697]|uniref:DUF2637 domain-containing protein n=1 Tax=Kitasatospora sp. NPDC006697 TaxID=3364020 RepID=UPI00369B4316